MKKYCLIFLMCCLAVGSAVAQKSGSSKRGLRLGVDRDTVSHIIASPLYNWYVAVGGGIQTFSGNEIFGSARKNKLNYNLYAEFGKWVLPDLSVSLHFSQSDISGQSRYAKQPFIDYTGVTPYSTDGQTFYPYQEYYAHAITLGGLVTLDWMNLIMGYDKGSSCRIHILTPVGLGWAMLYGKQVNPNCSGSVAVGDTRRNHELYFEAGVTGQWRMARSFDLNLNARLLGVESTFDWSPYDNSSRIFDFIPSLTLGVNYNILNSNDAIDYLSGEPIEIYGNRYFAAVDTARIRQLLHEKDSIQNILVITGDAGTGQGYGSGVGENGVPYIIGANGDTLWGVAQDSYPDRAALETSLDSLQNEIDALTGKINAMSEIVDANNRLQLPSVMVYFELDKYALDYNADRLLNDFARKIKEGKITDKYYIIGAADEQTGTPKHNEWLSQHRCQSIYDRLVKEYGIDAKQLEMVPLGGIREFEPKELNRVGIVVLQNDELTRIIDKWKK